MGIAADVARLMARELGREPDWVKQQVADFSRLARGYLPD
jgi:hypothetical protein